MTSLAAYIQISNACFLIVVPTEFLSHFGTFTSLRKECTSSEVFFSIFLIMSELLHRRVVALVFNFLWNAIHILCPSCFCWFFACQFLGAVYLIGSLPFMIHGANISCSFLFCFSLQCFLPWGVLIFIFLDISMFPLWSLCYPGPLFFFFILAHFWWHKII